VATTAVDGRTARAQRTRDTVVRALLDLVMEGDPRPTAREIAARAGISLRSVYVHFDDLDDLFVAAVQVHLRDTAAVLTPVDASLPVPERIEAFARQRATLFERFGPVRRAAAVWAPSSDALRDALERGAAMAWHDTVRLFGALLTGPDRVARLEAVNAAGSPGTWDHLRLGRALGDAEARAVIVVAVTAVLAAAGTETRPMEAC
jgi:AcrR family transcriptional regulator